jgi:FAD/FMN-containing dehydrogenase
MAQVVSEAAVQELREGMVGDVITPDHAAYDEFRKVWNGDVDKHPAVIAVCAGVDDVRAALEVGRRHGMEIAVRSGGHSWPGYSTADGALVIDLRRLNKVTIDAQTRRARVQGGAVWNDVDQLAQQQGLAVTGGHVTHTGVAGLTLGGGLGHLHRKYGLSSDNLLSAEVVTPDGRVLRASGDENPDLFWGLRGGGGNFGIVTEFEFQLHPLGNTVWAGLLFYAAEQGAELMRTYRQVAATMPDEVSTLFAYMYAPPLPIVPEELHFRPIYAVIVVATDTAAGERTMAPLREFGPPLFEMLAEMPYLAVQSLFDEALPHGTQSYLRSTYFDDYTDEVIDRITESCAKLPPGPSQMLNIQMGGAIARVPEGATAFGGRQAGFLGMFVGIWQDPAQKPDVVQWVKDFSEAMSGFSSAGAYVNLSDRQTGAELAATYGDKLERLRRLKRTYDPDNTLHLNQNISPS